MPLNPVIETVKCDRQDNLDLVWRGKEAGHQTGMPDVWLMVDC